MNLAFCKQKSFANFAFVITSVYASCFGLCNSKYSSKISFTETEKRFAADDIKSDVVISQKQLEPSLTDTTNIIHAFYTTHGSRQIDWATFNKRVDTLRRALINRYMYVRCDFIGFYTMYISRNNVFYDSFVYIADQSTVEWMLKEYEILFKDECGLDNGGLRKEWLSELVIAIFAERTGLFVPVHENSNVFVPEYSADIDDDTLRRYKFVGRIMAEIVVNSYNIRFPLAKYIYRYILNQDFVFEDIKEIDEHYYCCLASQIANPDESIMEILKFSDIKKQFSSWQITEETVTGQNIKQYFALYNYGKYIESIKKKLDAIKSEFLECMSVKELSKFNADELCFLICGYDKIDLDDWMNNTHVRPTRKYEVETVEVFWKAMKQLDEEKKRSFLRFCTGLSSPPIGGFKYLRDRKFSIRFRKANSKKILLVACVCANQLYLPICTSIAEMKEKLELCCANNTGFWIR